MSFIVCVTLFNVFEFSWVILLSVLYKRPVFYHTNLSLFTPSEDFIFFKLPRTVLCRNVLNHFHNCVIKMLIFVYLNWNFYTKYMYSDCVVMSLKYQIFSIIWYPLLNLHYIQRYIYNYVTLWRKFLEIIHVLFYKQVMKYSICLDQWFIFTNSVKKIGRMEWISSLAIVLLEACIS